MLIVHTSTVHGFGCFADQPIAARTFLGYYEGRRLLPRQLPTYAPGSPTYYWKLSTGWYIDGAASCRLRYMNHSCEPNVQATEVRVGRRREVQFVALRDLPSGSELFLDYQLDVPEADTTDYSCLCGASSCRLTMRGSK
jgi:SET domain-containing protein